MGSGGNYLREIFQILCHRGLFIIYGRGGGEKGEKLTNFSFFFMPPLSESGFFQVPL